MLQPFRVSKSSITDRSALSVDKYFAEVSKYPRMTIDEEVEAVRRMHQGDKEARKRIIEANLRFVVSVAKSFQYMGLDLPDLINEGNIGMMTALDKFDETRGFKFISFAVWWIRQAILNAIATTGRIVRLPLNQIATQQKINNLINIFAQEHERQPSDLEMAQILNISPQKIREARGVSGFGISMDKPITDDGSSTMLDVTPDTQAQSPDDSLLRDSINIDIDRVLDKTLSERDRMIVQMSFGIGGREYTLDEIGYKCNLSRERVRQIKEKAIRRLKSNSKARDVLNKYTGQG